MHRAASGESPAISEPSELLRLLKRSATVTSDVTLTIVIANLWQFNMSMPTGLLSDRNQREEAALLAASFSRPIFSSVELDNVVTFGPELFFFVLDFERLTESSGLSPLLK